MSLGLIPNLAILFLLVGFVQLLPILAIGTGGVLCLKKGYVFSASAILISATMSFLARFGVFFLQRIPMNQLPYGLATVGYISQLLTFLAEIALAVGLIALVRNVAARTASTV